MKKYSLGALVAAGLLVGGLSAGSASAAVGAMSLSLSLLWQLRLWRSPSYSEFRRARLGRT